MSRDTIDSGLGAALVWLLIMVLFVTFNARNEPFTASALFAAIPLLAFSGVTWSAWLMSALLAVPLIFLDGLQYSIVGLSAGCLTVGTYRWARHKTDWYNGILPLVVVCASLATSAGNVAIRDHIRRTLDSALLAFERETVASFSYAAWQWCRSHWLIYAFFFLVYKSLPCIVVLAAARQRDTKPFGVLWPLLLSCLFVAPFYVTFPAVGPAHITDALAARNCFPSLHVTWALLLWMNTRTQPLRNGLAVFAFLTALSTLALGEHYLIDIAAAIPYALGIQWTAETIPAWSFRVVHLRPSFTPQCQIESELPLETLSLSHPQQVNAQIRANASLPDMTDERTLP